MLAPEDGVGAGLAGGACVQHVVQTKFAVVALLGWKLAGLDDPQFEHIVHPPAVVLHGDEDGVKQGQAQLIADSLKKLKDDT